MFFTGFNHSIWSAVWLTAIIFGLLYLVTFLRFKKNTWYFFDPKHSTDARLADAGDFGPHAQRYQDLAKLLITLATGAIAFMVNAVSSSNQANEFTKRLVSVAPVVVGFFGCSIAFLMGFMFSQTSFYETYCHSPTHSTYTRSKYSLSTSFGWTGLIAFLLAFGWLAQNVFTR
jgi:hypothetical protein